MGDSEHNKALVRRLVEIVNERTLEELREVAGGCSGTQEGEWRGNPPTGRRFEDVDEVYVFRVQDGKLDSAIAVVEDNLTRMRQLGVVPSG